MALAISVTESDKQAMSEWVASARVFRVGRMWICSIISSVRLEMSTKFKVNLGYDINVPPKMLNIRQRTL